MAKTLELNGNHFRYETYGNSSSNQFGILLLGALQEISSVEYFSKYFSQYVNTIVIEAPGTGENASLQGTVTIREQAEMVLDLIRYLEIPQAHLFAFSYATAISVELCVLWEGVSSLSVACGVPGIPSCARMATLDVVSAARINKQAFANTFLDVLTSNHPSIPRSKAIRRASIAGIMKYDDYRIESFIENTIRLLAHRPTDIQAVSMPCVIVAGEHDPYATIDITRQFCNQLKQGYFVIIKDADHLAHLQQPEKMAEALITLARTQQQMMTELHKLSA